mgnify:FL=1
MNYTTLKTRYSLLKERCATLFEQYNFMITAEKVMLENAFMCAIGQYEYEIFKLSLEVKKWKRRFELRQASINQDKKPDLINIELQIENEFKDYLEKLKREEQKIESSNAYYNRNVLSQKESTDMRVLYLNAAKKLHPDINPNQTANTKDLWLRINEAFKNNNWSELKFLTNLVNHISSSEQDFTNDENGLTKLNAECLNLEKICITEQEKINDLKKNVPWSYKALLENTPEINRMQKDIMENINAYEKQIKTYEQEWEKELSK